MELGEKKTAVMSHYSFSRGSSLYFTNLYLVRPEYVASDSTSLFENVLRPRIYLLPFAIRERKRERETARQANFCQVRPLRLLYSCQIDVKFHRPIAAHGQGPRILTTRSHGTGTNERLMESATLRPGVLLLSWGAKNRLGLRLACSRRLAGNDLYRVKLN